MSAEENRVGCGAFDAETAAAYLEGALPEPERELYESHLLGCAACSGQIDELRAVLAGPHGGRPSPYAAPLGYEEPPDTPRARGVAAALQGVRVLRVRTLFARVALAFVAVAVVAGTAVLLALATRSQIRLQPAPSGIKYAPARPIPPAGAERRGDETVDLDDVDSEDDLGFEEPSFRPGVSPSYPIAPLTSAPGSLEPAAPPAAPPRDAQRPSEPPPAEPAPESAQAPAERPAPLRRAHGATPSKQGPAFRRVGDKTFRLAEDGFLVDSAYTADAGLPVVQVTAGSAEYNALLTEKKDLGPFFRLSDRLVVVVDNVVYRVVPRS